MERVAIVDGYRTPFIKSGTDFSYLSNLDLAKIVTSELINRTELDTSLIDEVIMGTVFTPTYYPNIAREIILGLGLPKNISGYTVTRACASSIQSITSAAESIMLGRNNVVIAGGSESLSNIPINYSQEVINNLKKLSKTKAVSEKALSISKMNPKDLIPSMPEMNELSTGHSMGEHAEMMARKNRISREEQDRYAYESHLKASKAYDNGFIKDEIITTFSLPDYKPVSYDNNIRKDPSLESMAKLSPAFDKVYGTVTAANSSPLTDGAAATLLMSEKTAAEKGYKPKAFIKEFVYSAIDPNDQMLLGNAYSIPQVLEKAGLKLNDIGLIEMHEAFAVQVLSTLQALASDKFSKEKLGRDKALGEIDPEIFNIYGGSIAIGHPFGATGSRIINTLSNELLRQNKQYGLLAICAAGGMSVAMILEVNNT